MHRVLRELRQVGVLRRRHQGRGAAGRRGRRRRGCDGGGRGCDGGGLQRGGQLSVRGRRLVGRRRGWRRRWRPA